MRFTWTGLLLAPLLVPMLLSAALVGAFNGDHLALGFLILLVPGCVVSYGTTILLFLPGMFLLSRCWTMTGFTVCLLGLILGVAVIVPMTWLEWQSSGPDSGPPTESFFAFFPRWAADPLTAIYPLAGLMTAGLYWRLGTWRLSKSRPAQG